MARRLRDSGLSSHIAGAFDTYSQSVQNKDGKKPWSSMQTVEISALVKMLPFTLRGLLAPERKIVQSWKAAAGDGPDAVTDPSETICDFLGSGNVQLYAPKVYYVIPIERILCKADILRDPVTPTIPADALPTSAAARARDYPHAKPGSELYIYNNWSTQWGLHPGIPPGEAP